MKREWKKLVKRIGVFALTVALLFETVASGTMTAQAAADGTHVYVETYLDGVLSSTQDLGVKTGWVDVSLPYKAHYSLKEVWVGDKAFGTGYCGFSMSGETEDKIVKLYYVADQHTITFFDTNGNNATVEPAIVNFNQIMVDEQIPEVLKDEGIIVISWELTGGAYAEFGWEIGKTYTKEQMMTMRVGADMTFKAADTISAADEFTVTYMDADKTTVLATVETEGRNATYPKANPTKEAVVKDGYLYTYEFAGWVDENGNPAKLTGVMFDKTVYASYTETKTEVQEYTVKANAGAGEFADGTTSKTYSGIGVGTTPSLETPQIETTIVGGVKTEYTFAGWVDANGNKVDFTDAKAGEVVEVTATYEKTETTLYYSVTVDNGDGSAPQTQQVQVSTIPTLTDPAKSSTTENGVKTDYTFTGWKYTVDGEEITDLSKVDAGKEVVATAQYATKETTLYYDVVVDENNGNSTTTKKVQVSTEPVLADPVKEAVVDASKGVKTEYTFAGWEYKDADGNVVDPSKAAEGTVVYAEAAYTSKETPIYYNVVVDGDTENPVTTQVSKTPALETPDNYTAIENGKKVEYIFTEWKYTDGQGNEVDPTKVGEGTTVYAEAQYERKTLVYTVNYDAAEGTFANGEKTMSSEVAVGSTPAAVAAPERENTTNLNGIETEYEFIGWTYINDATGSVVTDLTTLEAGATVTAKAVYKATEQSYKVVVQYNNGKDVDSEYTVAAGADFVPPITPDKADTTGADGIVTTYEFAGWKYEKADGTVAVPGETQAGEVIYAKATYTATAQKYTVSYDANGGSFADSETTKTVEAATGSIPTVENPTKASETNKDGFEVKYTFDKWTYIDENGNTVTDLSKVTAGSQITAAATYTAQEQSYTVKVDEANGTAAYEEKVSVDSEPSLGTPVKEATTVGNQKTTYTFDKWVYTDEQGNEVDPEAVEAGEVVTATATYVEKTETLTYTVIVNKGDGSTPAIEEVPVGTEPALDVPQKPAKEENGVRTEYEFDEWIYTDEDGNEVDPETVPEGEKITATATYTEKTTDLLYNVKVDEANGSAVYDETAKVGTTPSLDTPVKEATTVGNQKTTYTFDKWVYTDANGKEVDPTTVGKEETITATATYTEKTETLTYTVVVDKGDGSNPVEEEVPVGTKPVLADPQKPAKEENGTLTEYEFDKWVYTDENGKEVDPETVPEGEKITATATYTEKTVDLYYNVKVDEANGTAVYESGAKVGETPSLGTPVKDAEVEGNQKTTYTFDKWVYTDEQGNEVDPATVGKDETITATATYTEKTETITYTVTVDKADGSNPVEEEVPVGTKPVLADPQKPAKEENGVRTEYEFDEWVYTDEQGNEVDPETVPEGTKVTATATYTEKTTEILYNVKVDEANGTAVYDETVKVGSTPALGRPTKETKVEGALKTSYTFDKWVYTDENGNEVDPATVGEGETITATATYYGNVTILEYRLILKPQNGNPDIQGNFPIGVIPPLPVPLKETTVNFQGFDVVYTFDKWIYTDSKGNELTYEEIKYVSEGEVVTGTAQYTEEEQSYVMVVDAKNGDAKIEFKLKVNVDPSLGVPQKAPAEIDGQYVEYTFDKWIYTDEQGNEVIPSEVTPGSKVTATATYTEAKTEMRYDVTVDEANGNATYEESVKVGSAPSLKTPVKEATVSGNQKTTYTFDKWVYTDASGDEVDPATVGRNEKVTATATYTEKTETLTYTVVVDKGDGSNPVEEEVPVGTEPALDIPQKPAKEENGTLTEYEFDEWVYTDENGKEVDPTTVPEGGKITATATYTEKTTDLYYKVNVDEANGTAVYESGAKVGTTPSLGTPVKEAAVNGNQKTTYTFDKWVYTDANGDEVDPATVGKDETITATATYTEKTETMTYTVVVDKGDGSTPVEEEVPVGTEPTLDVPGKPAKEENGVRTEYEFDEWIYTDENGNEVDPETVPEGEKITATATYTEKTTDLLYNVKVDEANGSAVYDETAKVGTTPSLGTPVKEAAVNGNQKTTYTFDKWVYTDANGDEVDPATVGKDETITATATYTAKTETMTTPGTSTPPVQEQTPSNPEPSTQEPEEPEYQPPVIVPVEPTVEEVEEEIVVEIEDEEPALDDGADEEVKDVVSIDDSEVALDDMGGHGHDHGNCYIHWIILLLSAAYLVFAGIRIADRKHKISELEDAKKEAQN